LLDGHPNNRPAVRLSAAILQKDDGASHQRRLQKMMFHLLQLTKLKPYADIAV
jgi:hypothetical protein